MRLITLSPTYYLLPYYLYSTSCGPPVGASQKIVSPPFFCCFHGSIIPSLRTNDQQMDGGVK